MRRYWLFGALFLSIALATLNLLALSGSWYWLYPWFDILMHILGGLTIGAFLVALSPKRRPLLYIVVCAVVFIGWEISEYVGGLTKNEPGYWFDTNHDLLDDAIGASIAYVAARFSIWR